MKTKTNLAIFCYFATSTHGFVKDNVAEILQSLGVLIFVNFPLGLLKLKIQRKVALSNKLEVLIMEREIIDQYQENTFVLWVWTKVVFTVRSVLLFVNEKN